MPDRAAAPRFFCSGNAIIGGSLGAVKGIGAQPGGAGHFFGLRIQLKRKSFLPCEDPAAQRGSANATYASPDFVPIFPPPAATTTYCRPFASYVAGVA
jgi:hypothetical protein